MILWYSEDISNKMVIEYLPLLMFQFIYRCKGSLTELVLSLSKAVPPPLCVFNNGS
jgi:hypothetical protein